MLVMVAEDDGLHRAFVRSTIEHIWPGEVEVIEASDGDEAIGIAAMREPPFVVLDLQLPKATGIDVARAIWNRRAETHILFWSNFADESYVRGVARIVPPGSVYGYVLKSASEEGMRSALRGVFSEGHCIIDREVRGIQHRVQDRLEGITDGEYESLIDVALGLTDKAIAMRRPGPHPPPLRETRHCRARGRGRRGFGLQLAYPRGLPGAGEGVDQRRCLAARAATARRLARQRRGIHERQLTRWEPRHICRDCANAHSTLRLPAYRTVPLRHSLSGTTSNDRGGPSMPFVNIRILKGHSQQRKNEIARRVTEAVSEVAELPKEAIWVVFEDVTAPDWYVGGKTVEKPAG
jgi:4-oxalocrotonate tautomerase family enzyme